MKPDQRFRKPFLDLLRASGKPLTVKVEGTSMHPFLLGVDRVTIDFCAASQLVTGDVAAYEADEKIVVHRVLAKRFKGSQVVMYQKGDNQKSGSWVSAGKVLGRVSEVSQASGRPVALRTPPWHERLGWYLTYKRVTCADALLQFLRLALLKKIR